MAVLQTPGKEFARRYFYETFLPSVLPDGAFGSGEFLVLLGEEDHEFDLLQAMGVSHITNVERDLEIVKMQQEKYGTRVSTYYMDVIEFIHQHLQSNRRFLVLNLDICGSYLLGLDPAMSTVLLHARRNPQTVVATYSSVGRDDEQLQEGLKSLLLFLWYLPEATSEMISKLISLYRQSGLSERVSWNMVLRHCFWLRSHMEHIAASAHGVGRSDPKSVASLFDEHESVWRQVVDQQPENLRYLALRRQANDLPRPQMQDTVMDMGLQHFQLVTYAATGSFYHNCYYALYSSLPKMVSPVQWLEQTLCAFMRNAPIYVDGQGLRPNADFNARATSLSATLWGHKPLNPNLRRVTIPPKSEHLAMSSVALGTSSPLDRRTIATIYRLVEQGANTTKELLPHLPPGVDPKRVTAHLAMANRGRKSNKSRQKPR